jgi:hypothetical protein
LVLIITLLSSADSQPEFRLCSLPCKYAPSRQKPLSVTIQSMPRGRIARHEISCKSNARCLRAMFERGTKWTHVHCSMACTTEAESQPPDSQGCVAESCFFSNQPHLEPCMTPQAKLALLADEAPGQVPLVPSSTRTLHTLSLSAIQSTSGKIRVELLSQDARGW